MRKLGLALSVAVLATGTVAHAQTGGGINNILSNAGTTYTVPGAPTQTVGPGPGATGGPPGTSFNSFVDVGATAITFESANAGSKANASSFSTVSFDVLNNTGKAINFNSTITGAGLGFYLADTSGGCAYSCPQATGHTFDELLSGGANTGFNFSVTQTTDGGSTVLYSLSGSLGMNRDGSLILFDNLGNADSGPRSVLSNFGDATGNDFLPASGIGTASGIGYVWDATDISFDIGNLSVQTLTYSTSVFSNSNASCISGTSICLVAYAGFGDPVGRGGGVENVASLSNFASFADGPSFNGPNGLISGIHFSPTTFNLPTFGADGVTFQESGVPEPMTWMSLIAGFGLLGAALRRRRVIAYN